nr:RNA-directed DNA polymerase, eukaryota, reverse transcriptase zinc-binding domain protein [Tanacetum cinerariifolium]
MVEQTRGFLFLIKRLRCLLWEGESLGWKLRVFPSKLWSGHTINRIASKWGKLMEVDDYDDTNFHSKRLCILTKTLEFTEEEEEDDVSVEDNHGGIPSDQEINNYNNESDVEEVPETCFNDPEGQKGNPSEDPFGIYPLLNKDKNIREHKINEEESSLKYLPGFTPIGNLNEGHLDGGCAKKVNEEVARDDNSFVHTVGVLEFFYRAFGLRINTCKSKIMGVNVEDGKIQNAASKLGCLVLKTLFTYLGTKVGEHISRKEAWKEVVDKVLSRLSKWKIKTLSIGVPSYVLKTLESIRSQFFNGQDHKSCKASWVKWDNVLTSRNKGGLGTRVIKAIHGDNGKLDKDVIVGGQTCWTTIVKEARSLKGTGINVVDLICLKLGNGDSSSFWDDKRHAGGVIKELFPRLYALELHKHATVRMKLMAPSLDNSFRKRVRSKAEESQFNSLLEIVQDVNLVPCEDRYFWSLESEGDYSVASIRKLIDEKRFQEVGMACAAGIYSNSQQSEKHDGRSLLMEGKSFEEGLTEVTEMLKWLHSTLLLHQSKLKESFRRARQDVSLASEKFHKSMIAAIKKRRIRRGRRARQDVSLASEEFHKSIIAAIKEEKNKEGQVPSFRVQLNQRGHKSRMKARLFWKNIVVAFVRPRNLRSYLPHLVMDLNVWIHINNYKSA